MGGSAWSENKSYCIVLYLLEFKKYFLLCDAHTHKVNNEFGPFIHTWHWYAHAHVFSLVLKHDFVFLCFGFCYWLRASWVYSSVAGWVYSSSTVFVHYCWFYRVWDCDFCLTPSLWIGLNGGSMLLCLSESCFYGFHFSKNVCVELSVSKKKQPPKKES